MGSLPMSLKGQLKKGKLQKAQLKRAQLKHSAARQSGLSMVELLVAMVIQFILLAAMIYVFSGSKQMFPMRCSMISACLAMLAVAVWKTLHRISLPIHRRPLPV